jgi:hypothetical protein
MKAPVLFLAFNRQEIALQSFRSIEQYQPDRLYLAVDGPRHTKPEEARIVEEIRTALTQRITWKCQVYTHFPSENMGCGLAPATAISWAFQREERLIIIEDDCWVAPSFFSFCDELLDRYEHNSEVWQISGYTRSPEQKDTAAMGYTVSRVASIWGWATWKRAWNQYTYEPNTHYSKKDVLALAERIKLPKREVKHRLKNLNQIKDGQLDVWDYQWSWVKLLNEGLSLSPTSNLVINLGLQNATHKMDSRDKMGAHSNWSGDLIHPLKLSNDPSYEKHFIRPTLVSRIRLRIRECLER